MSSSESDFSDGEDGSSDGEYAELPPHDKYKCCEFNALVLFKNDKC